MDTKIHFYPAGRLPFYILPTIAVFRIGGKLTKRVMFIEIMWARWTLRIAFYTNQTAAA